jgi:hypothetical protein
MPIAVAPVPLESVARWKSVLELPAKAVPMFEMVTEKVVALPDTAEVGAIEPAVRSGKDCVQVNACWV